VIAIEGNSLVFERANGRRSHGDVAIKARIHRNLMLAQGDGRSLEDGHIACGLADSVARRQIALEDGSVR
jgi:hypothetical protein